MREKAKVVLVLMEDDEKLKEERDFAVKTREKTSKGAAGELFCLKVSLLSTRSLYLSVSLNQISFDLFSIPNQLHPQTLSRIPTTSHVTLQGTQGFHP